MFDFDRIIERRGTHASKWDNMAKLSGITAPDAIAMWVADMDFAAWQIVAIDDTYDRGGRVWREGEIRQLDAAPPDPSPDGAIRPLVKGVMSVLLCISKHLASGADAHRVAAIHLDVSFGEQVLVADGDCDHQIKHLTGMHSH